jgi:hypothetical protein
MGNKAKIADLGLVVAHRGFRVLVKPRMDPSSEGPDGTTSDDLTTNERQEAFYQYQDAIDAKLEIW